MDYVSLHTHTTFSTLDSYGTPEQYVARAKELGHSAIAITEHGNTSSHPKLEQACKKHGIKPIYGCEYYVGEHKQRKKNHITVLAMNLDGYKNLLKLASLAYTEERFYYMPTIRLTDLLENQKGLIVLSGCLNGVLAQRILEEDVNGAIKLAKQLKSTLDHFYIEIQPLMLKESQKVNKTLIAIAQKLGIPLVATNDVHFLEPGDERVQWFLSSVRRRKNVYDDWGTMDKRCYLATGEEMIQWGSPVEAVRNTVRIADMCEYFELPKAEPVKYGINNPYETLVDWCRDGWRRRKIPRHKWDVYKARLFRELKLIKSKNFVDYFLVVADMVQWAKKQNIMVGPARGSAAGSLTAYLLGITEVDPIEWDLLFERFIDVSRYDPPDIDLDFQNDRREEVKEYLMNKYGVDRVANIAGYSVFKPKSLLDDIGRVFKIPRSEIEEAKNELIENGGTKNVDEIIAERWPDKQWLSKVEGMIRQLTVHAAGVIVASDKLEKYTTLGRDGNIMLDYRDAEYLGLMKIDVLGLRTLTILSKCLEAIGKDVEWLYNEVPLDDEATYRAFASDAFQGIFQFEGDTTQRICRQIKPTKFTELIDINALSRPGPLQSGATEAYIRGWSEDIHPVVTKYTARSRGQILFQEQIMKILREAGNLDWADVTAVRKLITKKQGAEKLAGIKQRFLQAFEDNPELGEEIWCRCGESGAYGFNVAHSTSYTFLGYYCMYLKVHYPLEFYWANLVIEPNNESLLREFVLSGGKVYGVKYGKSKASWTIDNGGLRAGYMTLKGIGPKTGKKLEQGEEPKGRIKEILENAGAFNPVEDDDYLGLEALRERLENIPMRDKIKDLIPGEYVRVAGKVLKMQVKNLREVIESQGREYNVRNPEYEKYVHLELGDETGTVNVTINRYKYADITLQDELEDVSDDNILIVTGEYNKQYQKIYAARVKVM